MSEYAAQRMLAALAQPVRAMLSDDDRNVWDLHVVAGSVVDLGCGGPSRCGPCALHAEHERLRLYEAELAAVRQQHRESRLRVAERMEADRARRARRLAREAALATRTAQTFPGARCRICATSADGSRTCRACGTGPASSERRSGLGRSARQRSGVGSVATGAPRPTGRPSTAHEIAGRELSAAQRSLVDAYFDEIDHQLQIEEAGTCLGD
jgi:hypothetical protein